MQLPSMNLRKIMNEKGDLSNHDVANVRKDCCHTLDQVTIESIYKKTDNLGLSRHKEYIVRNMRAHTHLMKEASF
jgi:hypothetical protein